MYNRSDSRYVVGPVELDLYRHCGDRDRSTGDNIFNYNVFFEVSQNTFCIIELTLSSKSHVR